jgi:LAO/AO transport system kinase
MNPSARRRRTLPVATYEQGVLAGDRAMLGRAITLVESARPEHNERAQELLHRLLPHTGRSVRVGITGVPGVGKSTFIERFGIALADRGHRVAVLAVDPSSSLTGGSILGDKTRMQRLSVDPRAFVRPSPAAGTLGGVARRSRETLLLCEAAGYDRVLVETVGVGQSETTVSEMVDFFLVLTLPGAGDELQGIKKGVLELADMIAVNKVDLFGEEAVRRARREYLGALRYLRNRTRDWTPPVTSCSGLSGDGLEAILDTLDTFRTQMEAAGAWRDRRERQNVAWMWQMVEQSVLSALRSDATVRRAADDVESALRSGAVTATAAAVRAALADLRSLPSDVLVSGRVERFRHMGRMLASTA